MRNIVLTIFVTLCLVSAAMAGPNVKQLAFTTFSATTVGSAIKAIDFRHKTVTFQGYSTKASTNPSMLSGTALVQCGPTSNGPWSTCVKEDGTAISATTNGSPLQWSDVTAYVRIKWTNTAMCMRAWLNLSE